MSAANVLRDAGRALTAIYGDEEEPAPVAMGGDDEGIPTAYLIGGGIVVAVLVVLVLVALLRK